MKGPSAATLYGTQAANGLDDLIRRAGSSLDTIKPLLASVDPDRRLVLRGLEPTALFVSARSGEGIDELIERIAELLPQPNVELDLLVPYDRGDLVAFAHDRTRVLEVTYEEGGTRMRLLTDERIAERLVAWLEPATTT